MSEADDNDDDERATTISVAVPVALDRGFSYRLPADLAPPTPGSRVVVPFGRRVLVGVVRRQPADAFSEGGPRLREIIDVLDPPQRPALGDDLLDLCEWIADYYVSPIGEVCRLALPGASMGVDARRAALSEAGRAALQATSGELLAAASSPSSPSPSPPPSSADAQPLSRPLEDADLRVLERLAEATSKRREAIAVASLRKLSPPIPALLRRLEELAEAGLVTLDTGEADAHAARTEPHYRRTDRLRGASTDEPALRQAVGRSKQRRALLDALELHPPGVWTPLSQLRGPFPRARQLLPPLLEAGLVIEEQRLRELDPFADEPADAREADPEFDLTDEQDRALASLLEALAARRYRSTLLHGVTGSGKTEVYMRLIAAARAEGGGAIILVPEIALTPQLARRFRQRFGDEVAVLHSGLTDRQRLDSWGHIRAGRRPIVIGARSAIFAPVPALRVIVVDEEHDGSFKQEEGVRYNARDVAMVRARSLDAVVVLGSATPSLESWHNVHEGRLGLSTLTRRPDLEGGERALPEVEVVSLREHMPDPDTLLSARLRQRLIEVVNAGEQAILFLNRRGYTTALSCKTCGSLQQCPDCSAPSMTYHLSRNRLVCHLCGHIEAAPKRCLACGSAELEHGAAGTERVETAIAADLPGARVLRLDRDTSRGKALLDLLGRFRRREADVIVGTQMLSKGHDFPGVTLVGVLRADHGLALPDFRSTERVFQLLTQVAGRAGRGDRPGRVVIQTWAPDHPAIRYAREHDYEGFAAYELAARARAGNPPIGHLALLRISGEVRGRVDARAGELGHFARDLAARVAGDQMGVEPPIVVLGPVDSPIERINRRHRVQILLRSSSRAPLRWVLKHLRHRLGSEGHGAKSTIARADVDPYGLL
ncbi:primosomal protein N' [Pseudenhygromyxa sp. WMMC2535]|uniref:replication restart helicase PriA n=1 Tax=Pseudenhygromyxa sp. WMMC2535 TaxID=2712867 RepID=UPI001556B745|nr:primosomal protein N' [Pseudenhygromyxa sp. WMMC2535]